MSPDAEALRRSLEPLIPIALARLQEGFGLRNLRVQDELEAEAALWSAASSFHRHHQGGDFADATTPHDLAAHLLRIAYNRAQRRWRRDRQMRAATGRGTTRDSEGRKAPRDYADPTPGPVEQALEVELAAYLRQAIDSIKEELRGRRRGLEIIQAHLEDMQKPQAEIAAALGINQSTVSRCLEWFRDRLRQMLAEEGVV
jgi:DNA-directed RNA polymerase specialized sigma24 family protein